LPGSARGFFLAAGACCALAACDSAFQPTPRAPVQIVAHLVLDLGAGLQQTLLERTVADVDGSIGIHQAQVLLFTPQGGVHAFGEDIRAGGSGPALYALQVSQNALIPGATYGLRIVTRGGDTVTGTTTIPNARPAPQGPIFSSRFNRATDTLRMTWNRVPGARSYQVNVFSSQRIGEETHRFTYSVFTDTTFAIPGTLRTIENNEVFPQDADVLVVVSAVDDNYYTYYHAQVDPFAGAPPSGLKGGLGVFGSVVPLIIRAYQVR
jgi:hypothetical protein